MMKKHSGQALVEVAIGLTIIAILLIALWAVIGPRVSTAMAEAIDTSISHAEVRHGTEALDAQYCLDKYGPAQTWSKPAMNRKANVCYEGDKFYVQILEEKNGTWYEITKFLKKGARSLGDVGTYLKNNGYVR